MKKQIILLAIALLSLACQAQNWSYSTNLFYALDYHTNIYLGEPGTSDTNYSDNFKVWANKINADMNLDERRYQAQLAKDHTQDTNAVFTNIVFVPAIKFNPFTVSAATNLPPTNWQIGTLAVNTNYLYQVIGTNANGTNWHRIAWDTNGW